MSAEPDDTVNLRGPRQGSAGASRQLLPWIGAAALGAMVSVGGAWWALRSPVETAPPSGEVAAAPAGATKPPSDIAVAPTDTAAPSAFTSVKPTYEQLNARTPVAFVPPSPSSLAGTVAPPSYAPPLASEAQILEDKPNQLAIYRFAPQPAVIVLQFPTLAEQALMLNRVAAFVEKSGFAHDAVVARAELDARIVATGVSPDDFYYGHDYRSADVMRFFSLAHDLNAQEQSLQALVQKLGWDRPGAIGALVTLVRPSDGSASLDASARAAILRHELSHGLYFTSSEYAAYCAHFWRDILTADERAKFVAFLKREGYDTELPDLMINETQAYLMHTPDRRFFSPSEVGITPQRVAALRQIFLVGMPPGWLRDGTGADRLP